MGLFDDLAGKAGAMLGGGSEGKSDLVSSVVQMLGSQEGGIGGLVSSFTKGGLGDIVSSWVGTGENKPINPDQITQGLGEDKIQQIAGATGLNIADVKQQLSSLLPGIIDKLTPDGVAPEGGILDKGLDLLKGLGR